jgi:hypothetical protein
VKNSSRPNIAIRFRKHDPFMWEASLHLGYDTDGKEQFIHFYGHTRQEVEQDLEDAYEFLGPERVALIKTRPNRNR